MLAVIDELPADAVHFTPLLPDLTGPLAREFAERGRTIIAVDWRLPPAQFVTQLNSLVTQHRLHLLHCNSLTMGRRLGALCGQLRIPCTSHVRDIMRLSARGIADLSQLTALVAVSDAAKQGLVEQGVPLAQIEVIHNGIDLSRFRPVAANGWLHAELGVAGDKPLIAAVGQICLRKGLQDFAQAATLLKDHPAQPHFLLIGERHSQKQESVEFDEAFTRIFCEAGMGDRLHRLGFRDGMERIFPELNCLLHAALQEPFGRVLLEAAACGTAIVATAVGGTPEMLCDGESALLVAPRDPLALATAAMRVLDDPLLRDQLRYGARQAVERFSIEPSAQRLLQFWQRAALRRGS